MSLEEAECIARCRLPEEGPDPLADWRASMPSREAPKREERKLDTMPTAEPEIDWADIIRRSILAEWSIMSEIVGSAIGEINNQLLDQVEQLIAKAADQIKNELRAEVDQMREEFFKRLDLVRGQGVELKAELEKISSKRKRAKAAKANGEGYSGDPLLLPAPLADASLAGNGDGREH
jgi:hypothetical protein